MNSYFKLFKEDPQKYLVGKNGETPELPTMLMEGDPITIGGNIQSAFVEPGCRLVVFDKKDFQGDWEICDAHRGWLDNVYQFMYDSVGYDWRYNYDDGELEDADYLNKKKPAYFTFDIPIVMSFYCECYEPLRQGFKRMLIRLSKMI